MNEQTELDAIITTALDDMPLAPLPPGLVQRVMATIAPPVFEPFRLRVSDVLIASVITVVFAIGLLVLLTTVGFIDLGFSLSDLSLHSAPSNQNLLIAGVVSAELLLAYALYEAFGDRL